jgi:hypothetical protein
MTKKKKPTKKVGTVKKKAPANKAVIAKKKVASIPPKVLTAKTSDEPVVEVVASEKPSAVILPIMHSVEQMLQEWKGEFQKCGCGSPAIAGLWHCEKCRTRLVDNFNVLCRTLSATHRGGGGAAICICGAGCGGSPSCSALSALQTAIRTKDPLLRYSIAEAVGWGFDMEPTTTFDRHSVQGVKRIPFVKAKDYDVWYGKTDFGNFYYTIQDNRGFDEAMKKSEEVRTKRKLKNFTWWCNSYYHNPDFQSADTLEEAIEACHVDLLSRIKSSLV